MKYDFKEWISLVIVIGLVGFIIIISGCNHKHNSNHSNYNPSKESSQPSQTFTSSDLDQAIINGINAGNNCNNEVGGVKEETFESFKSCVNKYISNQGYTGFDVEVKIKLGE